MLSSIRVSVVTSTKHWLRYTSLWVLLLSSHHVGTRDWTQVVTFGIKNSYWLRSLLLRTVFPIMAKAFYKEISSSPPASHGCKLCSLSFQMISFCAVSWGTLSPCPRMSTTFSRTSTLPDASLRSSYWNAGLLGFCRHGWLLWNPHFMYSFPAFFNTQHLMRNPRPLLLFLISKWFSFLPWILEKVFP